MYHAKQIIQLKQANSFVLAVTYTDEAGKPLSLAGIDIDVQVRDGSKQLLTKMVVNRLDVTGGVFTLTMPPDFMPAGAVYIDIRMIKNGVVRNSDIVQLIFSEVVTHG